MVFSKKNYVESLPLVEEVISTIHSLSLFEKVDSRLVKGISTSIQTTLTNLSNAAATADSSSSSSSTQERLFSLYKTLFKALHSMINTPGVHSLEKRDGIHKFFEMLVFTEVALIRADSSIPTEMEVESSMISNDSILGKITSLKWDKRPKKLLIRSRIRILLSFFADESSNGKDICNLFNLIEYELQEIIQDAHFKDKLRVTKYQIFWLEILYIVSEKQSEMKRGKEMLIRTLDQAVGKFSKQFNFSGNKHPKREESLLQILKEGILKQLKNVSATEPKKKFISDLIHTDVSRKIVYLNIYVTLKESEEKSKTHHLAQRTLSVLNEFNNSLRHFYHALNLQTTPNESFQDFLANCLNETSPPRKAISIILIHMKVSDALKIQK